MKTSVAAKLPKLDLASTVLCAHCTALLFGRVAFCPYCGEDGLRSWDGTASAAVARVESQSPSCVPRTREPEAVDAVEAVETIEAMAVVASAAAFALPEMPRAAAGKGWSTGRTIALAVCVTAMTLGAIQLYLTSRLDPGGRSQAALTPPAPPIAAPPMQASAPASVLAPAQAQAPALPALPALVPAGGGNNLRATRTAERDGAECSDALMALALCTQRPAIQSEADVSRISSR